MLGGEINEINQCDSFKFTAKSKSFDFYLFLVFSLLVSCGMVSDTRYYCAFIHPLNSSQNSLCLKVEPNRLWFVLLRGKPSNTFRILWCLC